MPSICCINNCLKSAKSMHAFPNPAKEPQLCKRWIIVCGNRRLVSEATPKQVYGSYRVCSRHFGENDFGPNGKLKRGVVPSLNLPDPLETISDMEVDVQPDTATPSSSRQQFALDLPEASTSDHVHFDADHSEVSRDIPRATTIESSRKQRKRSELLSEVNVSSIKELSPKARHFYKKAIHFKKKAAFSTKTRLCLRRKLQFVQKSSGSLNHLASTMDRVRARFFQCQVENQHKKPKGRRYTLEDKVLALSFYKHSANSYRHMSKFFAMPSRKTLSKLLNRIPIRPGLHNEVFSVLRAETRHFKNPLDKYCVLMFDEMSIQPCLQPNAQQGIIDGFEDYGFKRSDKIANHAQVFMLRGIKRKWKQPVYYNFVNGATKQHDIVNILKIIIRKCSSIGLHVVATVCDQGANNQAAINNLVNDTRANYLRRGTELYDYCFEIDNQKVIPLYDVPHLFKGLRNNLLKYDLCYVEEGNSKVAKWSDIFTAYKMDPYLGSLRLMPKITDGHVNPERINKMKVSKCVQVFSKSVAAAINVFAFSGTHVVTEDGPLSMEKRAMDTANVLTFFDKLFDSLNGSSFKSNKPLKSAVTSKTKHLEFWKEATDKLRSYSFLRKGSPFKPPSLKNLLRTIKNFELLDSTLRNLGFNHMMPRTFNQDPLENFFGKLRQRGVRNINPTPTNFNSYYKGLLVNQLTSSQSVGANCEDDNSEVFITLQRLITQGLPEEEDDIQEVYSEVPVAIENQPLRTTELMALRYVGGYVAKKIPKHPCCGASLLRENIGEDLEANEEFIRLKEYTKERSGLKYVTGTFFQKLKRALGITRYILNRDLHKYGLQQHLLKIMQTTQLTNCEHNEGLQKTIFNQFIKVNVSNYCTQINRILRGTNRRNVPSNAPKIFLAAKKMYINNAKRKKKALNTI